MIDFTATHLREMLRAYMGANQLTTKAFAKELGVSPCLLRDILNGDLEPQDNVLEFLKFERVVVYRRALERKT